MKKLFFSTMKKITAIGVLMHSLFFTVIFFPRCISLCLGSLVVLALRREVFVVLFCFVFLAKTVS